MAQYLLMFRFQSVLNHSVVKRSGHSSSCYTLLALLVHSAALDKFARLLIHSLRSSREEYFNDGHASITCALMAQCECFESILCTSMAQCEYHALILYSLVAQCEYYAFILYYLVAQCEFHALILYSLVAQCEYHASILYSLVGQCEVEVSD